MDVSLFLQCQRQASIVLNSNICLASTQIQLQTARLFSTTINDMFGSCDFLPLLSQPDSNVQFLFISPLETFLKSAVCSLSTCVRRTDPLPKEIFQIVLLNVWFLASRSVILSVLPAAFLHVRGERTLFQKNIFTYCP